MQEINERVAALEATVQTVIQSLSTLTGLNGKIGGIEASVKSSWKALNDLKELIERRITQEEKIGQAHTDAVKARLGGELAKIEALFERHCTEENHRFDKIDTFIREIHGRIDTIMLGGGDGDVVDGVNVEQNVGSQNSAFFSLNGTLLLIGAAGAGVLIMDVLKAIFGW